MSLQFFVGRSAGEIMEIISKFNGTGKRKMQTHEFVAGLFKIGIDMTGQNLPSDGISHEGILQAIRQLFNIPSPPKFEPLAPKTIEFIFYGVAHKLGDFVKLDISLFENIYARVQAGENFIQSYPANEAIALMRRLVDVPRFNLDDIITSIELCKTSDIIICSRYWLCVVIGCIAAPHSQHSQPLPVQSSQHSQPLPVQSSQHSQPLPVQPSPLAPLVKTEHCVKTGLPTPLEPVRRRAESEEDETELFNSKRWSIPPRRQITFYRIDRCELTGFNRRYMPVEESNVYMNDESARMCTVWGPGLGIRVTVYNVRAAVTRRSNFISHMAMDLDGEQFRPSAVARINKLCFDQLKPNAGAKVPSFSLEYYGLSEGILVCNFLVIDESGKPHICEWVRVLFKYANDIFKANPAEEASHAEKCRIKGINCILCGVNTVKCFDPEHCTNVTLGHIMKYHLEKDGTVQKSMLGRLRQY